MPNRRRALARTSDSRPLGAIRSCAQVVENRGKFGSGRNSGLRFGSATDSERGQIAVKGTLEVFEHITLEDPSGAMEIAAEEPEGMEQRGATATSAARRDTPREGVEGSERAGHVSPA